MIADGGRCDFGLSIGSEKQPGYEEQEQELHRKKDEDLARQSAAAQRRSDSNDFRSVHAHCRGSVHRASSARPTLDTAKRHARYIVPAHAPALRCARAARFPDGRSYNRCKFFTGVDRG
jgi:hypothetical protein